MRRILPILRTICDCVLRAIVEIPSDEEKAIQREEFNQHLADDKKHRAVLNARLRRIEVENGIRARTKLREDTR